VLLTPLRRCYTLRGIGSLASQLLQFLLPVVIYQVTHSVTWAGLTLTVQWVPQLTSLSVAGVLVDRFGVRAVYVCADVVRLAAAGTAVALVAGDPHALRWGLLGMSLVAGACFEQTFVAGEKAVRVLAPPGAMPRAQSILGGIDQAAQMAGPALGAALLVLDTLAPVYLVTGAFAASLALSVALPRSGLDERQPEPGADVSSPVVSGAGVPGEVIRSLRQVFTDPVLRIVVAMTMVVNLMLSMLLAGAPALVSRSYHHGGAYLGVVYTIAAAASIVVLIGVPALVRRAGLVALGAGSAVLVCASFAAMGLAQNAGEFAVAVVVFLCVESTFTVFIRTVRAHRVAPANFGSVVSVIVLLNFLPMPVGGLLVAASRWTGSLAVMFIVTGIAALAVTVPACRRMAQRLARPPGLGGAAGGPEHRARPPVA
jgi:MFS transporter